MATSEKILVVPDLDSYQIQEGQIKGVNVFDDSQINDAADAAQAAASKLIIAQGADATYTKNQWYFLNCDDKVVDTENGVDGVDKFSYDYLIDSSLTYDLEVNGTLKSYQVLLNNAETVVSESGKLFATGETLRVMGGTFTVQGIRTEDAADPAASEVFTGTWGLGTHPGEATQIKGGYLQINQGAVANFNDTVVFINAGWFNVNKATVAFDNTYIYLGSGGSYAPVAVQFQNGANVTLANNSSMVYDPEFTMNITVDATSTFALSDSKLSATSLTNDGKFTVAGESTLNIASLLGEESVDLLDGAIIKDSTIGGSVFVAGNVTFRGDNTFGMIYDYGTLTDYYGTTAAMAWTVEAGSSVTLSNKDRYGLGYGDKVAVNGNIAANGAAAARATLEDEDSANDVKQSLFMHGLVAMEGKGWNCDSSFTVNNAFVTIGSNNSFGNKPGNYGGNYTFSFDNSVVNASRITFYEAPSITEFTLKDSDVKTGQFMTRDKDSVYTLDNTDFLSTSTINGNDEGNYNAGTLNVTNGSTLTYSSKMFNEENGVINIENAFFKAPEVENNNVINVTGESYIIANVSGNGITLNNATLTADTNVSGSAATKVYGTSEIKGTVGTVHANWTGSKENGLYAGYTTEDVALTLDGATAGNVYVGSDTEGYGAELTVKGGSKVGGIYDRVYGSTVITGSDNVVDYISAKGSITIENAENTEIKAMVAEGADITVTDSEVKFAIGTNNNIQLDEGTQMTISGSKVDIQQMTIDATSSLVLTNSTVTVDDVYDEVNLITNNGSITIDALSTLTADSIANNGTIIIDAAGFSGDIKTVIDLSGTASIEDRVEVINKAEGVSVIYGADGDVMLTKDTLSTSLYFDWKLAGSGYNVGDKVADGKYFGINTFASIDGLKDVVAGADTLTFAGGNETSYYTFKWDGDNNAGRFYLDHSATITTTDGVALFGFDGQWGGAGMYIVGDDTKVVFDADSKIKSGDLVIGSGAELSIGGYLTMGVFNAENRSEMRKGVFNFSGKVTIEDGADFTLNGGMLNNGTLVLNEHFTIQQTQGAGSSSFGGKAESSTEINGVTFTFKGFNDDRAVDNRFFVGGRYDWLNGVQQDIDSNYASIVTLTGGAAIVINNAQFIIGAKGVVNLDSSCSITVDGAVTNRGVINFTFAESPAANTRLIDANAASNYGTVTVTGAAAGLEAVTVGEDLYLLDMSKIYVNSDYAGLAVGDAIEGKTGVYFGINAFASLETISDAVSKGDRTVVYTYKGNNPAAQITVTNDAKTSSLLSYSFDGRNYNFYSGSRTHEVTLTQGKDYTFDFAKGDFSISEKPIVANTPEAATDNLADSVQITKDTGAKEYTFAVAEGKVIDLSCAYDNVSGTGRVTLYSVGADNSATEISTRLFSNDGTFVANGLKEGNYKVVFESYDDRTKANFGVTFDLEETVVKAINAISDGTSYNDVLINSGAVTKEYTFEVAADKVTDFTCAYSDVNGTGRLSFFKDGVQLSSRLFSSAGTFKAQDLTGGSYKVVFASYDDRTKVGFDVNFDLESSDIGAVLPSFVNSADDLRNNRTVMDYNAVDVADIAAWGGLNAADGLDNWVGTKDKTDWFGVQGIAAGTHNFGVDVEGDAISVTLYSFASGKYTTLAVFTVSDKNDGAADYTHSVKVADGAELVCKVSGLKSDSQYSIAIA